MDAPPVALVSLLTTDRRLIYRPVQHLTSCQSGTWKNNGIGSRNVVNGNQACGSGQYSKAYCPSGSQMISGGYSLTRWSGGSGWNSPDDSRPSLNENAWLIYTGGGVTGGTCMTAIALCTSN